MFVKRNSKDALYICLGFSHKGERPESEERQLAEIDVFTQFGLCLCDQQVVGTCVAIYVIIYCACSVRAEVTRGQLGPIGILVFSIVYDPQSNELTIEGPLS